MFDLEHELRTWRAAMTAAGLAPEAVAELEEHLHEDMERQTRAGIPGSEAWHIARQRIGDPRALRNEFDLAGQIGVARNLYLHKGKLFLCSGAGILAALALHLVQPAAYHSETKLLIRVAIQEGAATTRVAPPRVVVHGDARERIMREQMDLLLSSELAQRVAQRFGADRILNEKGAVDFVRAGAIVRAGLAVWTQRGSTVVHISFRHPNAELVPGVLREVVDQFLRMHVEAHRALGDQSPHDGRVTNISLINPASPPSFDFAAFLRLQALPIIVGIVAGVVWVLLGGVTKSRMKFAR